MPDHGIGSDVSVDHAQRMEFQQNDGKFVRDVYNEFLVVYSLHREQLVEGDSVRTALE